MTQTPTRQVQRDVNIQAYEEFASTIRLLYHGVPVTITLDFKRLENIEWVVNQLLLREGWEAPTSQEAPQSTQARHTTKTQLLPAQPYQRGVSVSTSPGMTTKAMSAAPFTIAP